MKRVLVERDNGEIVPLSELTAEERMEFMILMNQILFNYSILQMLKRNDGKN